MVIHRKTIARKNILPNAAGKRRGRGSSTGTLYSRRGVSADTVKFVEECILPHRKRITGWKFLDPAERKNLTSIAKALVDKHIVTCTTVQVVKAALVELDLQGFLALPDPDTSRSGKK